MSIQAATPYLFFNGTAARAVELYQRALGAKVEHLQRYGEVAAITCAPQDRDRVVHALLRIGPAQLMLSDRQADTPEQNGGNVHVCLDFADVSDMTRKFEALSASGQVKMALHDTFWGAKFGALVDEFGIQWMFNCSKSA